MARFALDHVVETLLLSALEFNTFFAAITTFDKRKPCLILTLEAIEVLLIVLVGYSTSNNVPT